jgi:hypothetical protein
VEFREAEGEACGLWWLLTDIAEFGKEEVLRWPSSFVLTPGVGFWSEGGRGSIDGFVRFILAFAHYPVTFSGCNLIEMLGVGVWRRRAGIIEACVHLEEVVHDFSIGQLTDYFGLTSPYPHSIGSR